MQICDEDVRRLMRAIASTGDVVPIRVISHHDGTYDFVAGSLRIAAAERLGYESIPAFIDNETDHEILLRTALAEQEASFPLKTLERGWALVRLEKLRMERNLPHLQKDLAELIGKDEGTVSLAIRAARAIPEERLERLTRDYGVSPGQILSLPRKPLGRIARAATESHRDELLKAACNAISNGLSATRAVEDAHEVLTNADRTNTVDNKQARRSRPTERVRWLVHAFLRWLNESFLRIREAVLATRDA